MRSTLRALPVALLLVAAVFLLIEYVSGFSFQRRFESPTSPVATSGVVERARERGAAIGETAAIATKKVQETVSEAALATKIKAKMALDDSVTARAIDVTTYKTTVTLSGTVGSTAERERAMSLARETAGVGLVIDNLLDRQ